MNNQTQSVTLTFGLGGSIVRHIILICLTFVPYYFKILPYVRELQPGHKSKHTNTETACMTFTFEIGVWFFRVTCRLDMLNIVPYYFKILQWIRKLHPRHESMHKNIETASVNLTFEIGALFYCMTHRQVIWKSSHAV